MNPQKVTNEDNNSIKLSFCKINAISDTVAEIIVNDGIEVTMMMVEEYHRWITENLSEPVGLLINKINKYTYTFEAQMNIANLPQIKAMAVVTYSNIAKVSTDSLNNLPREKKWNLQMFDDRDDALEWLEKQLEIS